MTCFLLSSYDVSFPQVLDYANSTRKSFGRLLCGDSLRARTCSAQFRTHCHIAGITAVGLLFLSSTLMADDQVTINSNESFLYLLLIKNNFTELKTSVFKKVEEQNLFQITCADVVERFKLLLFCILVAVQNLSSGK